MMYTDDYWPLANLAQDDKYGVERHVPMSTLQTQMQYTKVFLVFLYWK